MKDLLLIAGPCSVESKEQILSIGKKVKELGVDMLRGGAFKPRTLPTAFQGLGEEGLKYLKEASEVTGLPVVTEVMGCEEIELIVKYAEVLQIGSRNMQNFDLLKKIGERASGKTVILKRGLSATKKEVLGAIGYLKHYGHKGEIIVCERGIRTFADGEYSRFTLDVAFISDLKNDPSFNHKIIVDPSHPAGKAELVEQLTYAGIAAGADGFIIEVKEKESDVPLSDAEQAITLEVLERIILKVKEIAKIVS